jgi:hypothetical protein
LKAGHSQGSITERYVHASQVLFLGPQRRATSFEEFRSYLTPEREDELTYQVPSRASDFVRLSDEELARLYRKLGFSGRHNWDRQIEMEMIRRFTIALKGFSQASDR